MTIILGGSFYGDFPCFHIHEYYVQGAIMESHLTEASPVFRCMYSIFKVQSWGLTQKIFLLFLHTCIPLSRCNHRGYFYGGFPNFYII